MMIETLNAWSGDVFALLVDMGLKGFGVLAIAGVVSLALRRASASTRHLVWSLALGGLLLLPVLHVLMPGAEVPVVPPDDMPVVSRRPVAEKVMPGPQSTDVETDELNALPPQASLEEETVSAGMPVMATAERYSRSLHVASTSAGDENSSGTVSYAFWMSLLWLAGMGVFLLSLVVGMFAVWRLKRSALVIDEAAINAQAREWSAELGLRRTPRLLSGGSGAMPMTGGLFRPVVFLPREWSDWPEEQRRSVLLHELAHIRRRDCFLHTTARLAAALHWFNPLAWLALRQLRVERERACDDLVLSCGESAEDYAAHLLDIAGTMRCRPLASAAAVSMARKGKVRKRLLAILDPRRNRKAVKWYAVAIGVLLLLAIVVPTGLVKIAENRVFSDMSDQQRADFERWLNEPIALTDEEWDLEPYSPELMERVKAFIAEVDKIEASSEAKKQIEIIREALKNKQFEDVPEETMLFYAPLYEAWAEMVKQPDYTVGVLYAAKPAGEIPPFVWLRDIAKYSAVRMHTALQQERTAEALREFDLLLLSVRAYEIDTIIIKSISVSLLNMIMDDYEDVLAETNDPTLRDAFTSRMAKESDQIRKSIRMRDDIPLLVQDHISMLRIYAKAGRFVFEPGNITGLQCQNLWVNGLIAQDADNAEKYYPTNKIYDNLSAPPSWNPLTELRRDIAMVTMAQLYGIAEPGFSKLKEKSDEVLERYERLILESNAKLHFYIGEYGSGSHMASPFGLREGGPAEFGVGDMISKVTWRYLGREDGGWRFAFTRKFPAGTSEEKTTSKEVVYKGGMLPVFVDEHHYICIESDMPKME